MPYRKRRPTYRKRPYRGKRTVKRTRRRMTRTRVPRNLSTGNLIHVKLRHSDVALWVNDSILDKQFYYRPQLNQLNNYSQYANLWDFYRFNKVVLKFFPV